MASESPLILVVEDDAVLRMVTCAALSAGHYRVVEAGTGQQALVEVAAHQPDAILLDLGLPDMDGLDVIRQLREPSRPPVIVFSARGREQDKTAAIDAGACDYLAKPFVFNDLLARLRHALHRSGGMMIQTTAEPNGTSTQTAVFQVRDLSVNLDRREVLLNRKEVRLTSTEFRLLLVLINNAGRVVTQRQLQSAVWGSDSDAGNLHVRVSMGQLRRKLDPDPAHPQYVKIEPGVGYRLIDD